MRSGFLAHWFTTAVALGATTWMLSGVQVDSLGALAVAALVLGFTNAIIRPVLVLLTLPFTVLTLGLFYFVINGVAFGLAAALVPGFRVSSFFSAILGAAFVGLVSWFIGGATGRRGSGAKRTQTSGVVEVRRHRDGRWG
jgi:putative membrane protein